MGAEGARSMMSRMKEGGVGVEVGWVLVVLEGCEGCVVVVGESSPSSSERSRMKRSARDMVVV